ncbi:MAG: Lrp/AsnC family transcriptional regulator [Candidatus Bathyarchaeia archaeon]
MVRAFIFLNVAPSSEADVLQHLKAIEAVEEAYVSYGVYDLIIRVKAETAEQLKGIVTGKVRSTNGVLSTLTLMMIEEQADQNVFPNKIKK